ncbi:DUF1707 SHOCT-like domain-containing protein [Symbioplanes lichenis]|uniref:DUF1707 SHOCT-like domain-containing protein n=1 Tax=Symbioplanes lichenis TaxID=1629072 RepID=UPI002738E6A2|nr:DUF1707 domain-containing protein [Actinoplanes lichenis]
MTAPNPSGPARMRTSDTEREQIAAILRAAMAEGRLTLEEGEERLGVVYAAKFRDELAPLTADLPHGGRDALARTPEARAMIRRETGGRFAFIVVLGAVLTGLWFLSGAHFFWPAIPLAFLVLGTMKHARHAHHPHWHSSARPRSSWE